jgi:hypothetical protein
VLPSSIPPRPGEIREAGDADLLSSAQSARFPLDWLKPNFVWLSPSVENPLKLAVKFAGRMYWSEPVSPGSPDPRGRSCS